MEIKRLIEQLRSAAKLEAYYNSEYNGLYNQAADTLEKLQAKLQKSEHDNVNLTGELAKVAAELELVKQLYESEKEDFIDFACSGVPNLSPYCLNRHPDCVDERGWCKTEKCRGFSRERGQKGGMDYYIKENLRMEMENKP